MVAPYLPSVCFHSESLMNRDVFPWFCLEGGFKLDSKGGVTIFFIPQTCSSQDTDLNAHVQGVQRPRQVMPRLPAAAPKATAMSLSHSCCCIRAMERGKWETGEGFRERPLGWVGDSSRPWKASEVWPGQTPGSSRPHCGTSSPTTTAWPGNS